MTKALRFLGTMLPIMIAASVSSPARAVGADPAKATSVQREQAQSLFMKGKKLFQRERFGEALEAFRASHEIVASPNTRLLIARCLREEGRLVEAYVEFGRTAIEAQELEAGDPRYEKAAETAQAERRALESELGFVKVTVVNPDTDSELRVAGEVIKRPAWSEPIPVKPGSVEVSIVTPGFEPVRETVTLGAGRPVEVKIEARGKPIQSAAAAAPAQAQVSTEATSRPSSLRPYAYVAGGIGAAGLATFAIAGTMAKSDYDDLESECQGPCPPERHDDIDSGRRKQTIANVGLAVGIIGLGVGTTLYFMGGDGGSGSNAGLVVSPGWIGVRGRM